MQIVWNSMYTSFKSIGTKNIFIFLTLILQVYGIILTIV